jgi:thioredoxin-like negative regulator of GroEL
VLIDAGNASDALAVLGRFPEVGTVGHLAAKARLVAAGIDLGADTDTRLEELLGRAKDDDASRQELVDLLDALGPEDPRTPKYRKALAAKLF